MQIQLVQDLTSTPCDAWIAGVLEDEWSGPWVAHDVEMADLVASAIASRDFKPTAGALFSFRTLGRLSTPRVVVVGLGKRANLTAQSLGRAYGAALRSLSNVEAVGVLMPPACGLELGRVAQVIAEALHIGSYEFRRYKATPESDKQLTTVHVAASPADEATVAEGLRIGGVIGEAVCTTRDIANEVPAVATPAYVAGRAQELAALGLKVTVLDEHELASRGMGAILAVGQGSANPPRIVGIEHDPCGGEGPLYAVVGKGVTFDSGGLSLKPAGSMEDMKFDKSGACAVLGVMQAVARLGLKVRVLGVLGLAENMPDGRSYRPGDIVRSGAGKTIEVLNTDAEGRVVLADALYYAGQAKPTAMVDMATLTGAVMIALGDLCSGILGNDDSLIGSLIAAGEATGERLWQLPLWPEYDEKVKSEVADLKNIGERGSGVTLAGTIAGASFLKAFVPEGCAWAHLDIAGTASDGKKRPYRAAGATGFGVRVVTEWLRTVAAQQ